MSFIQIEAVRAIKLYGKSYRSAHQAALAYANSATHQLNYLMHKRQSPNTPPNVGYAYQEWLKATRERFYRRSHPIFTRYFKGK
jgi:hypothetical protein